MAKKGETKEAVGAMVASSKRSLVRDWFQAQLPEIKRALPGHLEADRFVRVALTAVQTTPKLLECTRESLLLGLMRAAQMGLEPDGLLGHGYLIPYFNSKTQTYEAQFQPGYQGLLDLARRSREINGVHARGVYANDTFDYHYGLAQDHMRHIPAEGDRGAFTHAYCVVRLKSGDTMLTVLTREVIDRDHKGRSRGAEKGGPWQTDYEAMAIKTAIRVGLKQAPKSMELARAISVDERAERGIPIDLSPEEYAVVRTTTVEPDTLSPEAVMGGKAEGKDEEVAG